MQNWAEEDKWPTSGRLSMLSWGGEWTGEYGVWEQPLLFPSSLYSGTAEREGQCRLCCLSHRSRLLYPVPQEILPSCDMVPILPCCNLF